MTCTSVNAATKLIRKMIPIPVISIEEPVARIALTKGRRIGILSSLATSSEPVRQTIMEQAALTGQPAAVQMMVADGAFEALMANNRPLHDELVRTALARLADEVDVVVFAQLSMALVEHPALAIPVLKFGRLSYEEAWQAIVRRCGA